MSVFWIHKVYPPLHVIRIFQSQMDFSLTSGPVDQGILSSSQSDSKAAKVTHSGQIGKSAAGTKVWWGLMFEAEIQHAHLEGKCLLL